MLEPPSREQVERDWASRGYSCELWTDPVGAEWGDFIHVEEDELILLLEGRIEIEMAGLVRQPKPGEEVLIPAMTIHTVRNIGEGTARWLYGYRKK